MRKALSLITLLLLYSLFASAQLRNIRGKILDEKGEPVPFTSIKIKGSKSVLLQMLKVILALKLKKEISLSSPQQVYNPGKLKLAVLM